MRNNHLFLAIGISLACLTSCTLYRSNIKHTDRVSDKIRANLEQPFKPADEYKMDTIAVKDDIWLGNQSIRANEGDPLPARFETEDGITLVSTTPVSLMQISEQLTSLTGITIRIDDMILKEVRASKQGEDKDADGGVQQNTNTDLFMPSYSGKLSGLLDQIASRFALWWNYKNGVISFYKMETRVFTLYALPVNSNLSANIAGTSSASGGSTSASMQSSVTLDFWNQIKEALQAMMPDGASMSVIQTNGTITVTAPPFTLQRVAEYINGMNDKLSRQVVISVKVLNVTLNDSNSMGLSVNAVLKFVNKKLNGLTATLTPTHTNVNNSLNMALVPGDKHIDNAGLLFDAFNEQGTTSLVTSATATTMNNRIAPIQVTTDESYIEKTETTTNSDSTSTSVTPAKINYGFTMEVLPRILDHGRLLIMFTMTLTQLEDMARVVASGTTVQLPKVRTRGFIQEIAMTSGSTLMLTGFEEVNTETGKQTELFGMANSAKKNRNVLVILLTPEVLISPLSPETRMRNL